MPLTPPIIGKRDESSEMAPAEFLRRHIHNHAARSHHSHHAGSHDHVLRNTIGALERRTSEMRAEVRRDDGDDSDDNTIDILLIVLGLVFFALIAVSFLFLVRRHRRSRALQQQEADSDEKGTLPTYGSSTKNAHGLTIETKHTGNQSVLFISRDGNPMLQNPHSPPHSPDNVPQIHITFPDECDEEGRRRSGRVLVVRVGDNATIGLEPVLDEQLPAYEKEGKGQFQSVDMDSIGGLKEKDPALFQ